MAKSSFPVPVSPVMRTLTSLPAAWARSSRQAAIFCESPMMPFLFKTIDGFPGSSFRPIFQGPEKGKLDGFERSRLFQIIPGAGLDGEFGLVGIAQRGDHDDFRGGPGGLDLRHDLQAASVGQVHVDENDVERLGLGFPEPLFEGVGTKWDDAPSG